MKDLSTEKPKPRKTRIDAVLDETIAKALVACHGRQQLAADQLGISSATMHERIYKSPYLLEVVHECRERRKDQYEKLLDEAAQDKSMSGIIFFLKTQAKDRGYVENAPIVVSQEIVEQFSEMTKEIKAAQEQKKKKD